MPSQTPYLQRRGDLLQFHLAVPQNLRSIIGCRELVRGLRTSHKAVAAPKALRLAAIAKNLFYELRARMGDSDKKSIEDLLRDAKHKLQLDALKDQHAEDLIEQKRQSTYRLCAVVDRPTVSALHSWIKKNVIINNGLLNILGI